MVRQDLEAFFQQAHKKKQQFYNENPNLEYLPTAEEKVHAAFDAKVKVSNQPVNIHIQQIHRVRQGGFKNTDERVYFYEEHTSHDSRKNKIEKFVVNGKYQIPQGQFQYDELTSQTLCLGIESYETEYPIKYDIKLLDEMVDNGQIDSATTYSVETPGGRMYSGFGFDDFRNLSFDELVFLGQTGQRPTPEGREIEIKSKEKRVPAGLKE